MSWRAYLVEFGKKPEPVGPPRDTAEQSKEDADKARRLRPESDSLTKRYTWEAVQGEHVRKLTTFAKYVVRKEEIQEPPVQRLN